MTTSAPSPNTGSVGYAPDSAEPRSSDVYGSGSANQHQGGRAGSKRVPISSPIQPVGQYITAEPIQQAHKLTQEAPRSSSPAPAPAPSPVPAPASQPKSEGRTSHHHVIDQANQYSNGKANMAHAVADAKWANVSHAVEELPHEMRKRISAAEEKAKELGRKGKAYAGECLGEVAGPARAQYERAADRMRSDSCESYTGSRGGFRASAASSSSSSSKKHFEGRHSLGSDTQYSQHVDEYSFYNQSYMRREGDGVLVDPRSGRELSLMKMDRHTLNDWYAIMHDFLNWRSVLDGADGCCIALIRGYMNLYERLVKLCPPLGAFRPEIINVSYC